MAIKTTWTSANPNYKTFPMWSTLKIQEFEAAGDTATANAWRSAIAAKQAAMDAAGYTAETPNDSTIITSTIVPDVPAFTNLHSLWVNEYGITFTNEEV